MDTDDVCIVIVQPSTAKVPWAPGGTAPETVKVFALGWADAGGPTCDLAQGTEMLGLIPRPNL